MSNVLQHHELQHANCPSLSPSVCSNPRPPSQWCHPTVSSSVVRFSSCPQSAPASGSLVTRKLQTKIIMKYHYYMTNLLTDHTQYWQGCTTTGTLMHPGRKIKQHSNFEKHLGRLSKQENTRKAAVAILGYKGNEIPCPHQDMDANVCGDFIHSHSNPKQPNVHLLMGG